MPLQPARKFQFEQDRHGDGGRQLRTREPVRVMTVTGVPPNNSRMLLSRGKEMGPVSIAA